MNKIVTTSLLIAAGITISACNVTTGTGKSTAYQFESDSDRRAVTVAQVTVTPASFSSTGTGSGSSSLTGNGRQSSAATGGSGRNAGQPGGTDPASNSGDDSIATAEDASRTNRNEAGDLDKGGATASPTQESLDTRAGNTHDGQPDKDGAAAAAAHAEAVAASTAGGPSKDGPNAASTSEQTSGASQQEDSDAPQDSQVVDSFSNGAGSVTTEQVAATNSDKDGDKDAL